ncbi:MAG: D-2-hydroxyacid dehydrogenase [Lachnospiraceae bacterium]|nr:D-2-hydroxyacid dehydrogenase [Lachnospiraceae bacterium]
MKIVVLERSSVGRDVSVDKLGQFGELICYDNTKTEEIRERAKDADILVVNKSKLNAETLEGADRLRLICEFATGFDNVDLAYCKKKGITVTNCSDYSTPSVAQHTFALALALLENLPYYDTYVKNGTYAGQDKFSHFGVAFREMESLTWGIVGMGHIGTKVAGIAEAFGCRVIHYAVTGKRNAAKYEQVSFDELLQRSDILSLHCPLSDLTHHLIDKDALSKMKSSAILINVARGAVVDNAALYEALTKGEIAAAGLDVVEGEPISPDNPLSNIADSGKLIITPHMAWGSSEARGRLVTIVCDNIASYLNGTPKNVVS